MKKITMYLSFIIASALVIIAFVTATNYMQLILAVILYPPLLFFAYKVFFQGKPMQASVIQQGPVQPPMQNNVDTSKGVTASYANSQASSSAGNGEVQLAKVQVEDIDKRTFLKLIGTAGITFFLFSILGKGVESLIYGRSINTSSLLGLPPANQNEETNSSASPTSGYNITQIDDSNYSATYYGFVNKDKSWFIMKENLQDSSYRYARGNSDFESNWNNRENLKYDYYYNLF